MLQFTILSLLCVIVNHNSLWSEFDTSMERLRVNGLNPVFEVTNGEMQSWELVTAGEKVQWSHIG